MKIIANYDLTIHNSYRLKSNCKRAFFPQSEADFITIYKEHPTTIKKELIGGGYNVIFMKPFYDKDFIIIGETFADIQYLGEGLVVVEAGANTKELSEFAYRHSLSGVEIFYDIPSSMGGAVVMNAGASGEEIKDVLQKVRYLDLTDLRIKEIKNEDIGFEYRNSFFQKHTDKIVLKVWLKLNPGKQEDIREKMDRIKAARWSKQPKEYPNAGSVFKRPKGHYVGTMVESLGLKGFTIGGAMVSKKHAGFIVNFKQATGEDIVEIIKHVKAKVKDQYQVDLEVEQRIIN